MAPVRRVLPLLVLVVVVSGCRIGARLDVRLRDDGTGTVASTITLDAEAAQRLEGNGRALSDTIRLGDLAAAGWDATGWTRAGDGSATLELAHEFADEDELRVRLRELDGGNIVRDGKIVRDRGVLRSRDEIVLDVDLRDLGTQIGDDEELVASLQAAGLDVAGLDAQLEAELRDALRVQVRVEAPGGRVTTVELAPGQQESVAAARSEFDTNRLVLLLIGALLAFLAVLLYLSAGASARRTRPRGHDDREQERAPLM